MWIRSIRLKNFKSYADAEFRFPEPADGRNLVLIGAENGHGKTTLLEAIYLCLYDKDAWSHFKRAGLSEISYPIFLNQALHHHAEPRYSSYAMSLEIEIFQRWRGQLCGLRIRRKWSFDRDKKCNIGDNEVHIHLIKDGDTEIIDEKDAGRYLNAFALPFDYAPFFFFDGERIVQAAEASGAGNWLNTALQGLLGVTLLNHLKDSLSKYRSSCITESASKKVAEDLRKAEAALQAAEASLDICKEELQVAENKAREWEAKRDSLTNQLGGGGDIKTSAELLAQKQQIEQQQRDFRNKVKEAVLAMPLAFVQGERLEKLQMQLQREAKRLNHEAGKEQIAERVDDFWAAFTSNEKVEKALGSLAGPILSAPLMKEAVKDCWDKLFYPLPDECAQNIEHNYLSQQAHAEIQTEINKLGRMPNTQLDNLLAQIDEREQQERDLAEKIDSLKNTNSDEQIEALKEANREVSKCADETGRLKANLERQELTFNRAKREVEQLQDKESDNNPKMLKSRRAGDVEKVIERLKERLLAEKTEILSVAATRINREIAHDARIDRVRIDALGKMTLFGQDGCETRVALSAGQMQILIMSLVSALAEVTQYQAPLVIDTPLARLDEGHRQGLFKHWQGLQQQVILLSQDTEITPEVCRQLDASVGKTYLVQAKSLATGGAQSIVTENTYFN